MRVFSFFLRLARGWVQRLLAFARESGEIRAPDDSTVLDAARDHVRRTRGRHRRRHVLRRFLHPRGLVHVRPKCLPDDLSTKRESLVPALWAGVLDSWAYAASRDKLRFNLFPVSILFNRLLRKSWDTA